MLAIHLCDWMRFTPMLFFTEANKMIDMGNWKNQKLTECWLRKGEQGGHYSQKRLRQCCEMDDFKYTRLCKAVPQRSNNVANLWQRTNAWKRDYAKLNIYIAKLHRPLLFQCMNISWQIPVNRFKKYIASHKWCILCILMKYRMPLRTIIKKKRIKRNRNKNFNCSSLIWWSTLRNRC